MKKKLYNAIHWFDEMVKRFGLECVTSELIHQTLSMILSNTMEDGVMIWDKDMVEIMYPQVVNQIRQEEREKVINELRFMVDEINRRLDNGK